MDKACGMCERDEKHNILVRKHAGKRSLRRPRHRWEDNIGLNLRKIGLKDVDWIHLAEDRDS
jgi:hypothetical protein